MLILVPIWLHGTSNVSSRFLVFLIDYRVRDLITWFEQHSYELLTPFQTVRFVLVPVLVCSYDAHAFPHILRCSTCSLDFRYLRLIGGPPHPESRLPNEQLGRPRLPAEPLARSFSPSQEAPMEGSICGLKEGVLYRTRIR